MATELNPLLKPEAPKAAPSQAQGGTARPPRPDAARSMVNQDMNVVTARNTHNQTEIDGATADTYQGILKGIRVKIDSDTSLQSATGLTPQELAHQKGIISTKTWGQFAEQSPATAEMFAKQDPAIRTAIELYRLQKISEAREAVAQRVPNLVQVDRQLTEMRNTTSDPQEIQRLSDDARQVAQRIATENAWGEYVAQNPDTARFLAENGSDSNISRAYQVYETQQEANKQLLAQEAARVAATKGPEAGLAATAAGAVEPVAPAAPVPEPAVAGTTAEADLARARKDARNARDRARRAAAGTKPATPVSPDIAAQPVTERPVYIDGKTYKREDTFETKDKNGRKTLAIKPGALPIPEGNEPGPAAPAAAAVAETGPAPEPAVETPIAAEAAPANPYARITEAGRNVGIAEANLQAARDRNASPDEIAVLEKRLTEANQEVVHAVEDRDKAVLEARLTAMETNNAAVNDRLTGIEASIAALAAGGTEPTPATEPAAASTGETPASAPRTPETEAQQIAALQAEIAKLKEALGLSLRIQRTQNATEQQSLWARIAELLGNTAGLLSIGAEVTNPIGGLAMAA